MPLEGKQLQNVAKTVQQVVNEEQREIEEIIKAVREGMFDKAIKGLAKKIDKATGHSPEDLAKKKAAADAETKEKDTQADAQKKIDAGEKAPKGWRKNADGKAVKSKDPTGQDRY